MYTPHHTCICTLHAHYDTTHTMLTTQHPACMYICTHIHPCIHHTCAHGMLIQYTHTHNYAGSNSDSTYFTAGFFDGSNGPGRHFSLSYQSISFGMLNDPNSLQTNERFRTITNNNFWLRCKLLCPGREIRLHQNVVTPMSIMFSHEYQFGYTSTFSRE